MVDTFRLVTNNSFKDEASFLLPMLQLVINAHIKNIEIQLLDLHPLVWKSRASIKRLLFILLCTVSSFFLYYECIYDNDNVI